MTNCSKCMNDAVKPVPYSLYETAMARNDRTIKRLIVAIALVVAFSLASNIMLLCSLKKSEKEEQPENITQFYHSV